MNDHEIIVDNFAGGGGASTGIEFATGLYVDVAINHDPGDILWVRETWQYAYNFDGNDQAIEGTGRYLYAADGPAPFDRWVTPEGEYRDKMPWRPSIFMPREAARIFLRVVDVRAERLNSIRDAGVIAEGIDRTVNRTMGQRRLAFAGLWNNINAERDGGAYAWERNPWVWVIEFERVEDSHAE